MAVDLYKLLFYRRRLRDPLLIVLILVLALAGLVKLPMLEEPVSGQVQVIDGDTLQIGEQRFRLFGIDAPEGRQSCRRDGHKYRCGEEATTALRQLIGTNPVTCLKQDTDSYGRIVAICSVGKVDLNRWMVAKRLCSSFHPSCTTMFRIPAAHRSSPIRSFNMADKEF